MKPELEIPSSFFFILNLEIIVYLINIIQLFPEKKKYWQYKEQAMIGVTTTPKKKKIQKMKQTKKKK